MIKDLDYPALQQCMHCGMCLPTCPTYVDTRREKNSPRGRISLMRAIADGDLEVSRPFADEMYFCLGCLACQTACPAGVDYARLFEHARAEVESAAVLPSASRRFWRWLTLDVLFVYPRLFRLAARLMWFYQRSGLRWLTLRLGLLRILPQRLAELEPSAPAIDLRFSSQLIAEREQPPGKTARYRVGLLTGCVQDVAFSWINRDTVDALLANSCEVFTPRLQSCCGSLHAHNGDLEHARVLARRAIDAFDLENVDAIISNAGGCGSHLKSYGHLLENDPVYAARARVWDDKVKDVHEWLVEIGFRSPATGTRNGEPATVTYHESCHLCHGQKITRQPRQILQSIPGLEFRELAESNWCCGSAGIYSITQPEQSAKLLQRKLDHLRDTGASCVATSNPGCHLQIQNGLRAAAGAGTAATASDASAPWATAVTSPVSLLAEAYRRETNPREA